MTMANEVVVVVMKQMKQGRSSVNERPVGSGGGVAREEGAALRFLLRGLAAARDARKGWSADPTTRIDRWRVPRRASPLRSKIPPTSGPTWCATSRTRHPVDPGQRRTAASCSSLALSCVRPLPSPSC